MLFKLRSPVLLLIPHEMLIQFFVGTRRLPRRLLNRTERLLQRWSWQGPVTALEEPYGVRFNAQRSRTAEKRCVRVNITILNTL